MMLRTGLDHLPSSVREELRHVTAILFEAFAETAKGRLSQQYRAGRILALLLCGPHAELAWGEVEPGAAYHLLVVVNHPRLARSERDWRLVRDRLRSAWEFGEITRPVRLTVQSLEQINNALIDGIPHFVSIAEKGVALYQTAGFRLPSPRRLPARERSVRSAAEFIHWHMRGCDFLLGAAFYRDRGNAPMAALLLHQACEDFYQCVLWSIRLHGPRTHALDDLREAAEALDVRLRGVWPRETRFERRAFGCIRRAYVEARYERSYRISSQELAWAFGRVEMLREHVVWTCADHQASLIPGTPAPLLQAPAVQTAITTASIAVHRATTHRRSWQVARRAVPSRFRRNRLLPARVFRHSHKSAHWVERTSIAVIALCLFASGAETAAWHARSADFARRVRSEPADPSAVLDFDVRANTVLGAVGDIANRAGYRIEANEDIWAIRWTGSYRAKATTFDALADILYGSGLCPAIRGGTITVRYCDKNRPPMVATLEYPAPESGTVDLQVP